MKTPLFFLAVLAATAFAQTPIQPQPVRRINQQNTSPELADAFADNYLVTLSVTENDKTVTELVVATARPRFNANTVEPSFMLEGNLMPMDDGTVLVSYSIGAEVAVPVSTVQGEGGAVKSTAIQYKTQSASAQVRIRLGESLNVLRTGARIYRMTISKLPEGGARAR